MTVGEHIFLVVAIFVCLFFTCLLISAGLRRDRTEP